MALPKFECPECGETKNLKGRRETKPQREKDAELVHVHCLSCEHKWTHDPWACPTCGGPMDAVREPLLQKAPEDRSAGWMSAT